MEWNKEKEKESSINNNGNSTTSMSVFGKTNNVTSAFISPTITPSTTSLSTPPSIFGSTSTTPSSVFGFGSGGGGGGGSFFGGISPNINTTTPATNNTSSSSTTTTNNPGGIFSKPTTSTTLTFGSPTLFGGESTPTPTTFGSSSFFSPKSPSLTTATTTSTVSSSLVTPPKPPQQLKPSPSLSSPSTSTSTITKGKKTNIIHASKLPHYTDINRLKNDLREHFSKFGTIKDLKVASFSDKSLSSAFGVIALNTVEEASDALKKGKSFKGHLITVKPFMGNFDSLPSLSTSVATPPQHSSPSITGPLPTPSSADQGLKSQEELLRNLLRGHMGSNNTTTNTSSTNNINPVNERVLPQIILPDTTSNDQDYDKDDHDEIEEIEDGEDMNGQYDEIQEEEVEGDEQEEEENQIGVEEIESSEEQEEDLPKTPTTPFSTPIHNHHLTPTTTTTTTSSTTPITTPIHNNHHQTPNHIITYNNNTTPISSKTNLIGTTHQPITQSIDSETGHKIGLCLDFCPPKEKSHRESSGDINTLEKLENGELLLVKKYKRNVAEEYTEIPPEEIRPPHILKKVIDHLTHNVVDRKGIPFTEIQNFIRDRSRSLRQDLTSQHSKGSISIDIHERCVRFHIVSHHYLCEYPEEEFNQFQNSEQLNNCLTSLKQFYDDHYRKHNQTSVNEAEFRSYYILNLLDQQTDLVSFLISIPTEIRAHPFITYAMDVWKAYRFDNYSRFFKLVLRGTYLQMCMLHRYFNRIRKLAIERISKAYRGKQGSVYPLSDLTNLLMFSNADDTRRFIDQFNLTVDSDQVLFKDLYIKDKISPTVSQIILNRAPKTFQQALDVSEPVQQSYLSFSKNDEHPSLPSTPPSIPLKQQRQPQKVQVKPLDNLPPQPLQVKPNINISTPPTTSSTTTPIGLSLPPTTIPTSSTTTTVIPPSIFGNISTPNVLQTTSTTPPATTSPSPSNIKSVFGNTQPTSIFSKPIVEKEKKDKTDNSISSVFGTTTKTTEETKITSPIFSQQPSQPQDLPKLNVLFSSSTSSSIGTPSLFPPPSALQNTPDLQSTQPSTTTTTPEPKLPTIDLFKKPDSLFTNGSKTPSSSTTPPPVTPNTSLLSQINSTNTPPFTPMAIGQTPSVNDKTPLIAESPMNISETPFGRFPSTTIFSTPHTPSPSTSPSPMKLSTPFVGLQKSNSDILKFPHDQIAEEANKQQQQTQKSNKTILKPQKPKKSHQEKSNDTLVSYLFRHWLAKSKQYHTITKKQIKNIDDMVISINNKPTSTSFINNQKQQPPLLSPKKKNANQQQQWYHQHDENDLMDILADKYIYSQKLQQKQQQQRSIQHNILPINIPYTIYHSLSKKNKNSSQLFWKLLLVEKTTTTTSILNQLLNQNQKRQPNDYILSKTEQSQIEYLSIGKHHLKTKLSKKPINICIVKNIFNNNTHKKIFRGLSSIMFEINDDNHIDQKKLLDILNLIHHFGYDKKVPLLFIGNHIVGSTKMALIQREIELFIKSNQDLWNETISCWTCWFDIQEEAQGEDQYNQSDFEMTVEKTVSSSLMWLAEKTPPVECVDIIPISCILDIVMSHDSFQNMFKPYYLASRHRTGLPLRVLLQPNQIIDKFNQFLECLATIITSPGLKSLYWPIPEFSDNLQSWNSDESFQQIKEALSSIKLPKMNNSISNLVGFNYSGARDTHTAITLQCTTTDVEDLDIIGECIQWIDSFAKDSSEYLISQVKLVFETFANQIRSGGIMGVDNKDQSLIIPLPWHSIFEIIISHQTTMLPVLNSYYHPDLIPLLNVQVQQQLQQMIYQPPQPLVGIIQSDKMAIEEDQPKQKRQTNGSNSSSGLTELTLEDLSSSSSSSNSTQPPFIRRQHHNRKATTTKKRDSDVSLSYQPNQKYWKSSSTNQSITNNNNAGSTIIGSGSVGSKVQGMMNGPFKPKSKIDEFLETLAKERIDNQLFETRLFNSLN